MDLELRHLAPPSNVALSLSFDLLPFESSRLCGLEVGPPPRRDVHLKDLLTQAFADEVLREEAGWYEPPPV
jgi:hypothetical protein